MAEAWRLHSIAEVETALRDNHGILLAAARRLGMTRQGLEKRIKGNERLQAVLAESRESIVDTAEVGLLAALIKKDPWAIQFTLRTLGRERGYAERIDIRITVEQERQRVRDEAEAQGLDADLAVAEFERMLTESKRA